MLFVPPKGGSSPVTFSQTDLVNYLLKRHKQLETRPDLQAALLQTDRAAFLPKSLQHMAYQDRLIRAEYEEMITNPSVIVEMILELDPKFGGNFLHLGGGLGYASSLLGFLAGSSGSVYSLERIQWFWERARQNFKSQDLSNFNLEILYRDGEFGLKDKAEYDGILVSFIFKKPPTQLLPQLKIGGRIVFPTDTHTLIVWEKLNEENEYTETQTPNINSYAFGEQKSGLA